MSHTRLVAIAVLLSLNMLVAQSFAADYLWWEGEDAVQPAAGWNIRESVGFSGGKMLAFGANAQSMPKDGSIATWQITVPSDGAYEFWARLGYRPWGDHEWRFDEGPWQRSSKSAGFFEFIKVPVGNGVTEMCWASQGKVRVAAGQHQFQIRMPVAPGQRYVLQNFDAFILSKGPFTPVGQYQPGKRPTVTSNETTYFPLSATVEPQTPRTIDLSFLNEPIGAHGFVQMNGKAGDLQFSDGTPVRFFGPNVSFWQGNLIYMDKLAADRFADLVSRLGANCVRLHIMHATNSLIDPSRNDTQEFDAEKLDRLEYLISALGKRNVYINLDLMFHRTFKAGDGVGDELVRTEGQPENREYNVSWACGAAAFWHPRVIELNLALYQKLLTHKNPYTGKSLVEMPQMAMCTIQNEQSIFWGTTNMRRGETARLLDEQYSAWLKKKYATQAKLLEAWQIEGQRSPLDAGEDLDKGTVKLGHVVQNASGPTRNRAAEQVRFLYDVETGFYQKWISSMRSWGVKCPIITSNWLGAGPTTRLVLQASTLGDIVDRHIYFGRNQTMLNEIGKGLPGIGFDQQAGRAFCVSEWNHGSNGAYQAETVPLMATVGAIQGWDALFQFCANSPTFPSHLGEITPGHYATYPFAAMIFRRGDIQTGPLVFERRRDPGFQFSSQSESRTDTTDPAALRFADGAAAQGAPRVPPQVLAIGRVQNAYVDEKTNDHFDSALVEKSWSRDTGVVTSAAGDVKWNEKEAWVLLDSPRTQGAFGAIADKAINAKDVQLKSTSPHAAIVVSSLDGKPIADSLHLLVGAVGRSVAGTLPVPGANKPADVPPCYMNQVAGNIAIRTRLTAVHAVSVDGRRSGAVPATRDGELLKFNLGGETEALWYEVSEK